MHPQKSFLLAALAALVLFTSILTPISAPARPLAWEDAPSNFVVLRDDAPGDMHAFMDAVKKSGGHVAIVYPPRAAVVFADQAVLAAPALQPWISLSSAGRMNSPGALATDAALSRAIDVWNASLEIGDVSGAGDAHELPAEFIPTPDAGPRPRPYSTTQPRLTVSDHMPYGAEFLDQSEYFAGSTAVGVWLLEAPAGASVHWDATEENNSIAGVQAGLSAWVRKGGDGAFLTFFFDIHTQVPVNGTPIENPQSWDSYWIDQVMTAEGWPGASAFDKCAAYNESIRDAFDTNWCYSIFIVDSNEFVNQGLFSGGGYAWAYFGGPWIYMSRYSTWAYNAFRYAAVVPMHETGHIFYDTDEYDNGAQQYNGYLWQFDNPAANPICIMNRNDSTTVCSYTRNQLGWKDLDNDHIIEPLDTKPISTLASPGAGPFAPQPTLTGSANVTTIPNLNNYTNYYPHHAITIATIDAVECRSDGGAWSPAVASDGAFDDYVEAFEWTPPAPLSDGMHTIESRAHTSVGNWTLAYTFVTIDINALVGVDPAPGTGFVLMAPRPNPASAAVEIPFALSAPGHLDADVVDIAGRRVATLAGGEFAAGAGTLRWSGRDASGLAVPAGVYLVRVRLAGVEHTTRVAFVR